MMTEEHHQFQNENGNNTFVVNNLGGTVRQGHMKLPLSVIICLALIGPKVGPGMSVVHFILVLVAAVPICLLSNN